MKYIKSYETLKDITYKNSSFQEVDKWIKTVEKFQEEVEPILKKDNSQELDELLKKYDLDINEFLFHRFNPGQYKNNLLHHVLELIAQNNKHLIPLKLNILKYLIENGSEINMRNKYGETPLLTFIRFSGAHSSGEKPNENNNFIVVEYLLENDADPNLVEENSGFQTPLTYCSFHPGLKIMKLLIKYGADPLFGKMYNSSDGSYLYTPYRAYFNNKNLDKLIYLIINYNIDPFEIQKNLLFNAGTLNHYDGNFFDSTLQFIPKNKTQKARWDIIKELYPDLLNYEFQKHLIENYGMKAIEQVIYMGPNDRIEKEYDEIGAILQQNKYNLWNI